MDKTETRKYYYPNLDKYLHYCSFGQRMRQIRKSRGLSQDEFAAMLGTSKQILSRYELEQRSPRIDQVSRYVDDAIMLGSSNVRIIHGKGTGGLRDEIQKLLRTMPGVATAKDEHIQFGGSGVTVVTFD